MLDELFVLLPAVKDLLALTPRQLDGTLLKCVAQRATSTDPLAAKYVFRGEIDNLYPIVMTANY